MIGELRHQHMGDGRLGRQPAFDQPGRRRCLHDHLAAGPAGVLRATHDKHPELGRYDVQAFRHVFADAM